MLVEITGNRMGRALRDQGLWQHCEGLAQPLVNGWVKTWVISECGTPFLHVMVTHVTAFNFTALFGSC